LEQRVRTAILAQRQQATNEAKKQALRKLERDFERVQATAQSCKAKVTRQQKQLQQRGGGNDGTNNNNTSATDNAAANALQQEQQRFQMQIQEDRLAEEIMKEREEEIRNINKGMHQVNEIYKDLAHIVGNQQEEVDQIETQMEDARGNAESGLKQVQTANEKYDSQCTIS
jgi:t-SNARE complex subunit (syntaxin)